MTKEKLKKGPVETIPIESRGAGVTTPGAQSAAEPFCPTKFYRVDKWPYPRHTF